MFIISVILQSFLLVSMAFAGGSKLAGAKNFVEMFESIELPQWFQVTGLVQLAGATLRLGRQATEGEGQVA